MKLKILTIAILIIAMIPSVTSCTYLMSESGLSSDIPQIVVLSDSIDKAGRLLAETLSDASVNNPKGSNESPHVAWDSVDGAAYYAVCMYDVSASWLHWLALDLNVTELEQGEYTSRDDYVGPYPPKGSGLHNFRIEVFALKQAVGSVDIKLNARQTYSNIENALDRATNGGNNVVARGSIIGKHGN